jgi:hypothetical protein
MAIAAFGSAATMAYAAKLPPAWHLVVADPSGFGGAFGELVARGMAGKQRDLLVLPANPRVHVLETAFLALQQQSASHDVLLRGLDAIAGGRLTVNAQTQEQVEQGVLGAAEPFQDLALLADRIFFRSVHELERACAQYGYRPARARILTAIDTTVPQPPASSAPDNRCIVVWAVGAHPALIAAFRAACFDVRTPLEIVEHPQDAAHALREAALIVALTGDPGTVHALAQFRTPMCAMVCGAAEIVENLCEFQPFNRVQIVDSLLASLRAQPAVPLPLGARGEPPPPHVPAVPAEAPLVTIVMPTYSRPNTLREGLQRLQQQTYPNIEIIVVNNAGTPVNDVVAQFSNARLIDRIENTGNATRPRNDGIEAASGEYVTFLDDDDVFFPDHVTRMVETLERSRRDAAYSDFLVRFVERAEDATETIWGWDIQKPFGITSYEMLVANRLGYFTVFVRRSLIEKIGPFAEEVLGGEEVEFWLRIARHTDFVHIAQPTSAYTVVRNWSGQLSEKSHALYAGGYEMVYERYPATGLPLVQQARAAYVASLRSTATPPPMQPRYLVNSP